VDGLVDLVIGKRGRDSIGYRGPRDGARHDCCDVGELSAVGQQCAVRVVPDRGGVTDGGGSRGHHGIGDAGCAHRRHGQADSREDVDVVALGHGNAGVADLHRPERGSGSDERTAFGPVCEALGPGLAAAGRIRQRHDDRPLRVRGDTAHDLFGEGPARGR